MASFPPLLTDPYQKGNAVSVENSIPVDPKQTDLATWIFMVAYHAKSASQEDRDSLQELAKNIPTGASENTEVQALIQTIESLRSEKMYSPTLSPKSFQSLASLSKTKTSKPACAKKLF